LQNILTAILQADSNGDYELGEQEAEILLMRLSTFSAADETKLREAMKKSGAVSTTTLYNHLVASGSFAQDTEEFDYTFGTSQWLFTEDA